MHSYSATVCNSFRFIIAFTLVVFPFLISRKSGWFSSSSSLSVGDSSSIENSQSCFEPFNSFSRMCFLSLHLLDFRFKSSCYSSVLVGDAAMPAPVVHCDEEREQRRGNLITLFIIAQRVVVVICSDEKLSFVCSIESLLNGRGESWEEAWWWIWIITTTHVSQFCFRRFFQLKREAKAGKKAKILIIWLFGMNPNLRLKPILNSTLYWIEEGKNNCLASFWDGLN